MEVSEGGLSVCLSVPFLPSLLPFAFPCFGKYHDGYDGRHYERVTVKE